MLGSSEGKTLLMASLLLLSAVLLWVGEYTEEGVKVEEGASAKEQGESSEPEKELSAAATETEVPMEVSGCLFASCNCKCLYFCPFFCVVQLLRQR